MTTMHPWCCHIGACWDLQLNDFSSLAQVKIQFRPLKKKSNFYMFPCCSTREDLTRDATITNVGLILTTQRRIQLFGTSQNSISNIFEKKNWVSMLKYSWRPFHWGINYLCRTNIDKARVVSFLWVRTLGVRTKFNFELFWKKEKQFFWVFMLQYLWRPFHWCINY